MRLCLVLMIQTAMLLACEPNNDEEFLVNGELCANRPTIRTDQTSENVNLSSLHGGVLAADQVQILISDGSPTCDFRVFEEPPDLVVQAFLLDGQDAVCVFSVDVTDYPHCEFTVMNF